MEKRATKAIRTAADLLNGGIDEARVLGAVRALGFGPTAAEMIVTMARGIRPAAPWL